MKKITLCITHNCNLACKYCYIGKRNVRMSKTVAENIIDFIFENSLLDEEIDIGFFGGEPLLEFELIKTITNMIENHAAYDQKRVKLSVVTNGTIFTYEMADFLKLHRISFCISCDGPPEVHDVFRRYANGAGSSVIVEKNLKKAKAVLPIVLVNAVYHPQTFQYLPDVIEYFSSLGLRDLYLNPDFSASWSKKDLEMLLEVYGRVGELYKDYYIQRNPHFISLIDSKIAVILRGGYQPFELCQMGKREMAFSPEGNIYLCERLIGYGIDSEHCVGNINDGIKGERIPCNNTNNQCLNDECLLCSINNYCMNWCGCSNYFSTGHYNRVSPFLCASEKAAIQVSFRIFQELEEKIGLVFMEHLAGAPIINSRLII